METKTAKEKLDRCEEVFGKLGRNVLERVNPYSNKTIDLVHDYFANVLYEDTTIDRKTRELVVIAIIAAQGGLNEGPLKVHLRSALKMGISKGEIVAVLETVAMYAGMPKCISALLKSIEVFEENA